MKEREERERERECVCVCVCVWKGRGVEIKYLVEWAEAGRGGGSSGNE